MTKVSNLVSGNYSTLWNKYESLNLKKNRCERQKNPNRNKNEGWNPGWSVLWGPCWSSSWANTDDNNCQFYFSFYLLWDKNIKIWSWIDVINYYKMSLYNLV